MSENLVLIIQNAQLSSCSLVATRQYYYFMVVRCQYFSQSWRMSAVLVFLDL